MKFIFLLKSSFILLSMTLTNGLLFGTDQKGKYIEGFIVESHIAPRRYNSKYQGSGGNKFPLTGGNAAAQVSGTVIAQTLPKHESSTAPSKSVGSSISTSLNKGLLRLFKVSGDFSHNTPVSQKSDTLFSNNTKHIWESNTVQTIQYLNNYAEQPTTFNKSEKFNVYSDDITTTNPKSLLKVIVLRFSEREIGNYISKNEKYLDNMTKTDDVSENFTSLLKAGTNDAERNTRVSKGVNGAFDNETSIKEFPSQLQKPNFSIEEIMRIIKREHNIQIKILNELVLYLPVLFCDILLLVACWKLLYHIFQQISERDQTNLRNEVSQVYLEPWSRLKKRTFSSWTPPNSGHHNYNESILVDSVQISCKRKSWFPPK